VVLLIILLAYLVLMVGRNLKRTGPAADARGHQWFLSGTALVAALVASYVVMGFFENLSWTLFGQTMGLLLVWLRLTEPAPAGGE
jgi:hypothetical protein